MAEKELKICEYCGKEYKPRVTDQKYCGKQCRWDYNNALKAQKLEAVEKQVNGVYTPSHASESVITTPVEVAPKIEQPRVSEVYFRNPMEVIEIPKGESIENQQFYQMMQQQIENQRRQIELLEDTVKLLQRQLERPMVTETYSVSHSVPMPNAPKIIEDDYRPMTAAEREADMLKREAERETVVVQVKENEKTDGIAQSSTNFASMIANMQSGKEGW